jgi:cellobiose-specific phosphotransferase system component IIA
MYYHLKYLGSTVNETNKIEGEIQSRIAAVNRAHHANKKLLTNELLSKNSKMSVYKTIIRPVVTYGSETWMMNTTHEEKLKDF